MTVQVPRRKSTCQKLFETERINLVTYWLGLFNDDRSNAYVTVTVVETVTRHSKVYNTERKDIGCRNILTAGITTKIIQTRKEYLTFRTKHLLKLYDILLISWFIRLSLLHISWKKDPYTYKQAFGSCAADAQSDQGLHCLLTESLDTTEYKNGEQRPGWYFAHAQDDLNLRILCMYEGIFYLFIYLFIFVSF